MRAELLKSFYVLSFMLILTCPLVFGWRSFKIVFTRCEYEANSKLVDVKIRIDNKSETALNVVVNTFEVFDDVDLSASFALATESGNYTNLISRTVNVCKMFKDRNADPLARMIYLDFLKHGKWFKECPVLKGTYTLNNYTVDEEVLPSFLPETSFKFTLRLSKPKGEHILKSVIYGRIDKSKGFNNLKMFSMG